MNKIQISKSMVNMLGKQKDAGYKTNLQPTVIIAMIEVYGESLKLKMDCFSKKNGNTGNFGFEVLETGKCIASGNAEFLLDKTEMLEVCFDNIADMADRNKTECFVRKCILLLNEFNYVEWKAEMSKKGSGKHGNGAKVKRMYSIVPKVAKYVYENVTLSEVMERLRQEQKSFAAKEEKAIYTPPEPPTTVTAKEARPYSRHKAAWYVRGHYDRYGNYIPFRIKKSKILVGDDYSNYRVPIETKEQ